MNGIVALVAVFIVFGAILATIAFVAYRRVLRKAKGVERGLKMVPLLIHLPPPSDDTENSGNRDQREVIREKISQAETLYDLIAGTAQGGFKSAFYGQRHIAFEIVASNGLVHYFAAVPIALVGVIEQAIVTAYPGARLEEVEDHNIFNPQGRVTGTVGGELVLRHEAAYPIAGVDQMERDPMSGLINALYKLQLGDGAAVQIMLRPANPKWTERAIKLVAKKRHTREGGLGFGVADLAKGAVKAPEERRETAKTFEPSKLEEQMMQAIEEKTKHPGFEVLIRVLASSSTYDRAQVLMRTITTSFALFEAPGSNGFQFVEGRDMPGLITAFIFRFFPPEINSNILNTAELAAVFHLPDAQFTPTTQVERQQSKQVDGPSSMPQTGLLLGYNFYRGVKKEIRLSPEDRRRHAYIVGQTGTGKSTMLENLAVQDMLNGGGFAFIDPHGDTAERLLSMVPKERAEDVVYFNPADMAQPIGLNLFEYDRPEQKDFLIQESINMLYKLYDPQKTGIIGPRFEHWYRNAALTLMADPHGASFIEVPKVFTDTGYLKNKFKYLNDPTVIDFWTKEMAQTSDYHKSEMLGWFVSKFGAFQSNEMMRNIIGQTASGFNLRDIMDNKKILIVNLSKGQVGELNSQLLGMIFVIKIQAAAMSRAAMPEDQRADFCLYVDEFQNFSTDSFASILSEARKYHLNLVVANQFIGQLTDEIRDAVFGNIGTMLTYRCGPEDAEFLVKQFQPIFDQRDLVNLPNHNAVMRLLIGGLPSQPFSITALPPLGIAHQEMGLAIKQLSAAKFGVTRQVVESDIFARLQNSPATVVPNAATAGLAPPPATAPAPTPAPTSMPMPTPTAPPPAPLPAPAPVATIPPPVASTPPAPVISPPPAPTAVVPPPPMPAPTPAAPAMLESPKPSLPEPDIHAAMLPPSTASKSMVPPSPTPEPTQVVPAPAAAPPAPSTPAPPPPAPSAPAAADELSLNQLMASAPKPVANTVVNNKETAPVIADSSLDIKPQPPLEATLPKPVVPPAPSTPVPPPSSPTPTPTLSLAPPSTPKPVSKVTAPPSSLPIAKSDPQSPQDNASKANDRPTPPPVLPAARLKPAPSEVDNHTVSAPLPKPVPKPALPTPPIAATPPSPPPPPKPVTTPPLLSAPVPKPAAIQPQAPELAPVPRPAPPSPKPTPPSATPPAPKPLSKSAPPPKPVTPPAPPSPAAKLPSQPVSKPTPHGETKVQQVKPRSALLPPSLVSASTPKASDSKSPEAKPSELIKLEHNRDLIPEHKSSQPSTHPRPMFHSSAKSSKSRPASSKPLKTAQPHLPSSRSLQPPKHEGHLLSAKDLNDEPAKTMIATQRTRPLAGSDSASSSPAVISVLPPTPPPPPKPEVKPLVTPSVPAPKPSAPPASAKPTSPPQPLPIAPKAPSPPPPLESGQPTPAIVLPSAKAGDKQTAGSKTSVPVPQPKSASITDAYAAAAVPQPVAAPTPPPPTLPPDPKPAPKVEAGMVVKPQSPASAPQIKPILPPSAVAHPGELPTPEATDAGPKIDTPLDNPDKPSEPETTEASLELPTNLAAVPGAPNLKPGEIYVDEKGNVIQG
ncbi:MAG TPA: hypothetical protein VMR75_00280 [Candidatus Saccharimonadales bacterium]|nr:hypothetical protein [Candidatus Saccharimonadales bacterium]